MLRLFVEGLMNIRCCCEQDATAYRTVLYPNHYSKAPGRNDHHHLRLERFICKVLKDVEGIAFGDVVVVTGLGELTQELEDLGRGRTVQVLSG